MSTLLSGILVVATGLWLIVMAAVIVVRPALAKRYLRWFASSARAHYTEMTVRLVAGAALVVFSSSMWHPVVFRSFGWLVTATSAALFFVPWRWHHRFGTWAIPLAIRHMKLYAFGSFALGVLILYGASRVMI